MTYNPNILLEVEQAITKRYAQETVVISGVAYDDGRILNDPEFNVEMPDDLYGVADPWDLDIKIDDLTILDNEVRGIWCKVSVYDETDGLTFIGYGHVYDYDRKYGISVTLKIKMNDDPAFEKLLPPGVVTTDIFHETAKGIGLPINVPLGYCQKILCPNGCWNTELNHYDFVVSYSLNDDDGDIELDDLWEDDEHGVWREDELVNQSEYELLNNTVYPGYAVLRFTTPQWDDAGNLYIIRADVKGLKKYFATPPAGEWVYSHRGKAIGLILNNSTFGLGTFALDSSYQSPGSDTVFTDEYRVGYCIGNGERKKAYDIINDLISPYGYLYLASDAQYEIIRTNGDTDDFNDTGDYFGDNDGYYNNCEIISGPNQLSLKDYPKTLKVNYNFRIGGDEKLIWDELECNETPRTYGTDIVFDAITSASYHSSKTQNMAERVVAIFWGRSVYSDYKLTIKSYIEGRAWDIGDKIYAANPDIAAISTDWFVTGFRKVFGNKYEFDLISTDDDFYDFAYGADTITQQAAIYDYSGIVKKTIDFTAVNGGKYAIDTRGYASGGAVYNRYRFESGALTTDSQGNDTLTAAGGGGSADTDSGDYVEGSASVELASSESYYIDEAGISANHPLKDGVAAATSFSILLCAKFDASIIGVSTNTYLAYKTNASPELGFAIYKNASDKIQASSSEDGTTSYDNTIINPTAVIAVNWYGIAYIYNADTEKETLHVRDITGDAVHGIDQIYSSNGVFRSSNHFRIGNLHVGQIDHVLVFDEAISVETADFIFTDPSNWGEVIMTLPTSPNSMHVVAYDAFENFNTENFKATSSAKYHGGTFGTKTYSTDGERVEFKFVDPVIGYLKS